jgi:hypothetical protein
VDKTDLLCTQRLALKLGKPKVCLTGRFVCFMRPQRGNADTVVTLAQSFRVTCACAFIIQLQGALMPYTTNGARASVGLTATRLAMHLCLAEVLYPASAADLSQESPGPCQRHSNDVAKREWVACNTHASSSYTTMHGPSRAACAFHSGYQMKHSSSLVHTHTSLSTHRMTADV